MGQIGRAAFVYFAQVFAAGFVLGTIRFLLIGPAWGEFSAVLLELPIMLTVSWLACGTSLRLFAIRGRRARLAMGVAAFALLMAAELALALIAFGLSPGDHMRTYGTPAGMVGLSGQIAFGLIPLVKDRGYRRRSSRPMVP
jgi:hypothetical protein